MYLGSIFRAVVPILWVEALCACAAIAVAAPPAKAPLHDFAGTKAGQTRKDNELGLALVWVPSGRFMMGSPKNERGRRADENQVRVDADKRLLAGPA